MGSSLGIDMYFLFCSGGLLLLSPIPLLDTTSILKVVFFSGV